MPFVTYLLVWWRFPEPAAGRGMTEGVRGANSPAEERERLAW